MKTTSRLAVSSFAIALLAIVLTPASAQITYTRLQADGALKVHQMRPDGSSDTVINLPWGKVGFPTWSQDGTQLAVTAFRPGNVPTHTWNVFQIANTTGVIRKLTDYHDLLDDVNVAFSYTFPWYKAYSRDRSRMATFSLTQTGGSGDQGGGGVVEVPVLEIHSLTSAANPILVHVDKTQNGRHHGGEGVDWSPTQPVLAAPLESSAQFLSGGGPGDHRDFSDAARADGGAAGTGTPGHLSARRRKPADWRLLDRARLPTKVLAERRRSCLCALVSVARASHLVES